MKMNATMNRVIYGATVESWLIVIFYYIVDNVIFPLGFILFIFFLLQYFSIHIRVSWGVIVHVDSQIVRAILECNNVYW